MFLRKINAIFSLLTSVLFLSHSIFMSVWMLSRCSIEKSAVDMPWVLTVVFGIHAVLSILLGILGHKGAEKRPYKAYPHMNIPTYLQRVTGILMILLLGLHIAGASNYYHPKMLHAVVNPLFYALGLAHLSFSTGRAMITLGIGNAKTVKIVDIVMKILCAAIFVAAVIGFYLCLFVGVAR